MSGGGTGSSRLLKAPPHKTVPATAPRPSRREVKYSGVKMAIEGESIYVHAII